MACPASSVVSVLPEDRVSQRSYCAVLEQPPALHPGSGLTSADSLRSAELHQNAQTVFQWPLPASGVHGTARVFWHPAPDLKVPDQGNA